MAAIYIWCAQSVCSYVGSEQEALLNELALTIPVDDATRQEVLVKCQLPENCHRQLRIEFHHVTNIPKLGPSTQMNYLYWTVHVPGAIIATKPVPRLSTNTIRCAATAILPHIKNVKGDCILHLFSTDNEYLLSGTSTHVVKPKTYMKPTTCNACKDMLLGIHNQGVRCSACRQNFHSRCYDKTTCSGRPMSKTGRVAPLNVAPSENAGSFFIDSLKSELAHNLQKKCLHESTKCNLCAQKLHIGSFPFRCLNCQETYHEKCSQEIVDICMPRQINFVSSLQNDTAQAVDNIRLSKNDQCIGSVNLSLGKLSEATASLAERVELLLEKSKWEDIKKVFGSVTLSASLEMTVIADMEEMFHHFLDIALSERDWTPLLRRSSKFSKLLHVCGLRVGLTALDVSVFLLDKITKKTLQTDRFERDWNATSEFSQKYFIDGDNVLIPHRTRPTFMEIIRFVKEQVGANIMNYKDLARSDDGGESFEFKLSLLESEIIFLSQMMEINNLNGFGIFEEQELSDFLYRLGYAAQENLVRKWIDETPKSEIDLDAVVNESDDDSAVDFSDDPNGDDFMINANDIVIDLNNKEGRPETSSTATKKPKIKKKKNIAPTLEDPETIRILNNLKIARQLCHACDSLTKHVLLDLTFNQVFVKYGKSRANLAELTNTLVYQRLASETLALLDSLDLDDPQASERYLIRSDAIFKLYYRMKKLISDFAGNCDSSNERHKCHKCLLEKSFTDLYIWFYPCMSLWLNTSLEKSKLLAIKARESGPVLEAISIHHQVLHSSSVYDLFKSYSPCVRFLTELEWTESKTRDFLFLRYAEGVSIELSEYAKWLEKKALAIDSADPNAKVPSPSIFVALNNVVRAFEDIVSLSEPLGEATTKAIKLAAFDASAGRDLTSPDTDDACSYQMISCFYEPFISFHSTYVNLLKRVLSKLGPVIFESLLSLIRKTAAPPPQTSIFDIFKKRKTEENPEIEKIEEAKPTNFNNRLQRRGTKNQKSFWGTRRCKQSPLANKTSVLKLSEDDTHHLNELWEFINTALEIMNEQLYDGVFDRILRQLWDLTMRAMNRTCFTQGVPPLSEEKAALMNHVCERLYELFKADGEGLQEQDLKTSSYTNLKANLSRVLNGQEPRVS